jgi:hypothetical protein
MRDHVVAMQGSFDSNIPFANERDGYAQDDI